MNSKNAGEDFQDLSVHEQDALSLSRTALQLDQARNDKAMLAAALEANMEVWVAIRTLVGHANSGLNEDTAANLIRLSQFVAETTMKHGVDIPDTVIDTLVNINLQISEGLLEGAKAGN